MSSGEQARFIATRTARTTRDAGVAVYSVHDPMTTSSPQTNGRRSPHSPDAESTSRSGSSPITSDSPSTATSSAVDSPPSPAFVFPLKKESRSILKSYSLPRSSGTARVALTRQTSAEPLSPERLEPLPPTPPMTAVRSRVKSDASDDSAEDFVPSLGGERTRSVRFKPRVRISSGTHRPRDLPTISHNSSFSDSSSISAPLRPPDDEHVRPEPYGRSKRRLPIDRAFTAEDFNAWLAKSALNHANVYDGPIEAWNDTAEETTALLAHRRRRRPFDGGARRAKGPNPPNYIVANAGLKRSPVPSPLMQKAKPYGTLLSDHSEEADEDEDSSDDLSGSSDKVSKAQALEAWASGWSGGWKNTQSWWSEVKRVFCCVRPPDEEPESPPYM